MHVRLSCHKTCLSLGLVGSDSLAFRSRRQVTTAGSTCYVWVDLLLACVPATNPCLTPTDATRSRRDRRARQRDFYRAQEAGAPVSVLASASVSALSGDRMSVASSTSTSSSNSSMPVVSGPAPADTKQYSSLSSLSDTESIGKHQAPRSHT